MFSSNPFASGSLTDEEIDYVLLDLDDDDRIQCECGTESVHGRDFKHHSFWCPRYIDG